MTDITIDQEFKSLIPPLTAEEYQGLEESLLAEGCRDALVLWNGILIDGHNRYEICEKHHIEYQTLEKEFESRNDVIVWIIKNQFGRRNLPAYERARLALQLKPIIAEQAKERQVRKCDFVPKKSWEQRKQEEIKSIKSIFGNDHPGINEIASRAASTSIRNERMADETHIYFAKIDEDKMKIGSSASVESRIQQLKVSAPNIELIEDVWFGPGARKFENKLKKHFNEYLISGEVYHYSETILAKMLAYTKREVSRMNETDTIIAEAAGVSHDTITKVEKIEEKAPEEIKQKARSGEISINQAYETVRRAEKEARKDEKKQRKEYSLDTVMPDDVCQLYQADIRNGLPEIEDSSIDFIITDPPYPKEYLPLYGDLARTAQRILKPGGSLIVMCGQSYFPEVIQQLSSEDLTYHWCMAYLTPGGQSPQLFQKKVNSFWKPVLWYVKGKYEGDWIGDTLRSAVNDNDKRYHEWGQSFSGMKDIVERFTNPGDLILDPFLGGGTTGAVAVSMGRRFIGTDINADNIDTSLVRIREVYSDAGSTT